MNICIKINPISSFLSWTFSFQDVSLGLKAQDICPLTVVHTCCPREEEGGTRLGVDEEGCPPGVDSLRTTVLSDTSIGVEGERGVA